MIGYLASKPCASWLGKWLGVLLLIAGPGTVLANEWWSVLADPALRQCVGELASQKGWQQLADAHEVSCHSRAIHTLDGVQHLSQLETLSLHNNALTDVSLRDMPQLKRLVLSRNRLKTLQLHNMPLLGELFFFDNMLTQLDLKDMPNLTLLKGNANQLSRFRYASLPMLEKIYLFNNKLPDIDIDHLPALRYMDVRQNPMPDELYQRMDKMNNVTFLHDGNAADWKQ